MAAIIRKMNTVTSILFLTTFFSNHVLADRIKKKIYIDLETKNACFRILNGTHEVGCTSSMSGNVGTIHYIQDDSDYDWILSKGPHDPYVAVMNGSSFTGPNVRRLYKSSRVVGIMVINTHNESSTESWPEEGFSTQDKCPNDNYGLYSNNSDYKNCKKGNWNEAGSSLGRENIDIPVFTLSTEKDVDNVLNKCFFPFNHAAKTESKGFPVCAAEMRSRMDAALDSRSCIRRSNFFQMSLSSTPNQRYCDPLGDQNIVATLMEDASLEPRKNDSLVVVAARIDSTSLFLNEYVASDTTVAGIVTMLASAEALWKVKDTIRNDTHAKDIMYTFFHGETFDYIGSSRMVYDMKRKKFPYSSKRSSKNRYLPMVELPDIDQIVEVNQVGRRDDDDSLWAHTDPLSQSQVDTKVQQMISDLQSFSKDESLTIQTADKDLPLPPASAQSFLKHRLDIPTVVLTDHKKKYTNKYYASRFDLPRFIDADDYPPNSTATEKYDFVTKQAQLITGLSTTLARYLYKASTGQEPSEDIKQNLTASSSTVTHLLYCFLVSPNCELFLESMIEKNAKSLKTAKAPYPFYVSVSGYHTNEVTRLIHALLARFTGQRLDVKGSSHCSASSKEKRFSYTWMAGQVVKDDKREGWCYRSTVFYAEAKSPAFIIDGYDMTSGEYSTWTESVWGGKAIGVRLFLIPSPELQASVLVVGILILIFSFLIMYLLYSRLNIIFSQNNQARRPEYNVIT